MAVYLPGTTETSGNLVEICEALELVRWLQAGMWLVTKVGDKTVSLEVSRYTLQSPKGTMPEKPDNTYAVPKKNPLLGGKG